MVESILNIFRTTKMINAELDTLTRCGHCWNGRNFFLLSWMRTCGNVMSQKWFVLLATPTVKAGLLELRHAMHERLMPPIDGGEVNRFSGIASPVNRANKRFLITHKSGD